MTGSDTTGPDRENSGSEQGWEQWTKTFPSIAIDYLEVSPAILETFTLSRPEASFYYMSGAWSAPQPFSKAGELLDQEKRDKAKTLARRRSLFLPRKDYRVYARQLCKKLDLVLVDDNISEVEAAEIIFRAIAEKVEQFHQTPTEKALEPLTENISILGDYLSMDSRRVLNFRQCLRHEESLANHATKVCLVGLYIASTLGVPEGAGAGMDSAALGFLLHDIGKLGMMELTVFHPSRMSRADRAKLEEHTKIGMNVIRRFKNIPPQVALCVEQHHERLNGSGYPRRLVEGRISRVARICAVSNEFCNLTANRRDEPGLPPRQAAEMIVDQPWLFDEKAARTLLEFPMEGSVSWPGNMALAEPDSVPEQVVEALKLQPPDPEQPEGETDAQKTGRGSPDRDAEAERPTKDDPGASTTIPATKISGASGSLDSTDISKTEYAMEGSDLNGPGGGSIEKTRISGAKAATLDKTETSGAKTGSFDNTDISGPAAVSMGKTEVSGPGAGSFDDTNISGPGAGTMGKTEVSGPGTRTMGKTDISGPMAGSIEQTEMKSGTPEMDSTSISEGGKSTALQKTSVSQGGVKYDPGSLTQGGVQAEKGETREQEEHFTIWKKGSSVFDEEDDEL